MRRPLKPGLERPGLEGQRRWSGRVPRRLARAAEAVAGRPVGLSLGVPSCPGPPGAPEEAQEPRSGRCRGGSSDHAVAQPHVVEVRVEHGHAVGRVVDLVVPRCAALRGPPGRRPRCYRLHAAQASGARGAAEGAAAEPHAAALGCLAQPGGDADCALVRVYGRRPPPREAGSAQAGALATHRLRLELRLGRRLPSSVVPYTSTSSRRGRRRAVQGVVVLESPAVAQRSCRYGGRRRAARPAGR